MISPAHAPRTSDRGEGSLRTRHVPHISRDTLMREVVTEAPHDQILEAAVVAIDPEILLRPHDVLPPFRFRFVVIEPRVDSRDWISRSDEERVWMVAFDLVRMYTASPFDVPDNGRRLPLFRIPLPLHGVSFACFVLPSIDALYRRSRSLSNVDEASTIGILSARASNFIDCQVNLG